MPTTYEPIATTTLGSDSASYTFSSISGTYTDLILVVSNLTTSTSGQVLSVRFNSDTGSNYSRTSITTFGSGTSSTRDTNQTSAGIGFNSNGTSTTTPAQIIAQIMNYANSTTYKTIISRCDLGNAEADAIVSMWRSTSAITSITVFAGAVNMKTGTMLSLYGIKAA